VKQIAYWVSWAAMASVTTLACFKLPTSVEITQLREQVVALQKQIENSSKRDFRPETPLPEPQNSPAEDATAPEQAKAVIVAGSNAIRETANNAEWTELLARVGLPAGTRPEDLRSPPVSVTVAGQRLLENFNSSPVAQHAFVTYSGCSGSSCAMDVNFSNARAAIEQEPQLTQWLSGVDGSCSFTLDAVALQDRDAGSVRHVVVNCGGVNPR
jgi:hypothetical protein